jgi:hypothetical protein
MSGSRSNASLSHRQVAELLPWYVNGTLEGPELDRMEGHLERCGSCRTVLAAERGLAHALRTSEELAFSPERALGRLRGRLTAELEPDRPRAIGWQERLRGLSSPVRWALAGQLLVIAALSAALLWPHPDPAPFQTLTTPSEVDTSEAESLRIVFNATTSEGDLRALLLESGGRIVAGPSRFGVYTIEVPPGALEATLEGLRSSPLVTFVEPGAARP